MAHSEIGRRGLLLVLSSPSGAGKTTITRLLVERDGNLSVSISATTRPPRANEVDGQHYHFVSESRFDRMVREGALLEHGLLHIDLARPEPEKRVVKVPIRTAS